ncbi:MAG TPA: plastocyanin [Gemmatimonadaceae bacterium]|nr:plastocyanin [Gemmatimonadaceae bacterium]
MRFIGQALLASVFVLGACAGGEKTANTDTTSAAAATATATTPSDSSANAAAPASGASSTAAPAAPVTGQIHEVKMIGDEKGYRFEPANLTIKQGDGVKFVMVTGGPHNVAFDENGIPAGAKDKLSANMPNQQAPLQSQFFMNPNESYTVSFAGLPAGTYNFHCVPHLAMGMKGTITVQ